MVQGNLGEISVRFTANLQPLYGALGNLKVNLKKNIDSINKELSKIKLTPTQIVPPQVDTSGIVGSFNKMNVETSKAIEDHKARAKTLGDGIKYTSVVTDKGTKNIITSYNRASTQTKKSIGEIVKSILNWRDITEQILHYITFTIGVQLVMSIRRGIEGAIEAFTQFNKSVTNVATVVGYTGAGFAKATSDIAKFAKEVTKGTIFTANQAAASLYSLASAGYDVVSMARKGEQGLENFRAILNYAAATQSDLEEATKAVTTAIKQFNLSLDDTTRVTDTFTTLITSSYLTQQKLADAFRYVGTTAGIVGSSIEETGAAAAVLANRGMQGAQVGQRLNMIFTKLLKPTDKARDMLARLGLTLDDINPKYHSLVEILYTLKAANFSVADASEMFRARTAAAAAALVENVEEINNYVRRIRASGGITEEIAQKQSEAFWGMAEQFKAAATEGAIAFGKTLEPTLMTIMRVLKDGLFPVINALSKIFTSFHGIIGKGVIAYLVYIGLVKLAAKHNLTLAGTLNTISSAAAKTAVSIYTLGFKLKGGILAATESVSNLGLGLKMLGANIAAAAKSLAPFLVMMAMFETLPDILSGTADAMDYLSVASIGLGASLIVLSHAFKAVEATAGPIGWVILAIGGIIGIFGMLGDTSEKTKYQMKEMEATLKDMRETFTEGTMSQEDYVEAEENLIEALKEEKSIREELNKLRIEGLDNTQEYLKLQDKLVTIQDEVENNLNKVIEDVSTVLTYYQRYDSEISNAITTYSRYRDILSQISQNEDEIAKLQKRSSEALRNYSIYASQYGETAEITNKARNEYLDIQDEINKKEEQGLKLSQQLGEANADASMAYNKVDDSMKEVVDRAKELIDTRIKLLDLLDEHLKLETELAELSKWESHWNELLGEGFKRLGEQKWKLYEIEMKRYKLQKGMPSLLDDLFNALAEEGLLTQDIIDSYVEMQQTQGESAAAATNFASVLGSLSKEGQDLVTDWLEYYIQGLQDGMNTSEAAQYANNQLGTTLESIVGSGEAAQDAVIDYGDALYNSWKAAQDFRDLVVPFTKDLYDNGIASENLADALWDVEDATHDASTIIDEYQEKLNQLATDTIQEVIDAAAKMWVALGGFPIETFAPEVDLGALSKQWDELKNLIQKKAMETGKWFLPSFQQAFQNLDVITPDLLRSMGFTEEEIQRFTIQGEDIVDPDSLDSMKSAFVKSLWELNQATGYFAAKTADAKTVEQAYIDYLQTSGIGVTNAYSQATVTTAIALKTMEKQGFSTKDAVEQLGGSFPNLQSMALNSLSNISSSADGLRRHINEIEKAIWGEKGTGGVYAAVEGLASKLQTLTAKPWDVLVKVKFKIQTPGGGILDWFGNLLGSIGRIPSFTFKKYGARILDYILPKYFPDKYIQMQTGGIIAGGDTINKEEFNILGPVNVTGIGNIRDLAEEFKYRYRMAGR